MARAYDAAGNSGSSALVSISVQNSPPDTIPPTVQVTSPTNGITVGKGTTVTVSANDNRAVTRVDVLIDGKLLATSSSSSPSLNWNTSKLSRGTHTVQAVAYDAAKNVTRSTVVTVYK
jgi:hypothetical protein